VVIIGSSDDWEVSPVQVVADWTTDNTLSRTEVMVRASGSFMAWDAMSADDNPSSSFGLSETTPWIVQRYQLAIWNYDSLWDDSAFGASSMSKSTSISNTKQRLTSLLSTLKTETTDPRPSMPGPSKPTKIKKSFLSGRARKAGTKKKTK
jgi:hypothetical protein